MVGRTLAILAAGLLLAGCSAPSGGAPTGGGSEAPKAGQPKPGGALNITYTSDPFDWDPTTAGISIGNREGWHTAYEELLAVKAGPTVGYNDIVLQPALAERWEVSPDAKSYTFHLRKGVKFANLPPVNGREVTAADVKWSFEYSSRTGEFKGSKLAPAKFASYFENLDRVEAPDAATVVVRFTEPFAPFLSYAADYANPIMPHEVFDREGNLTKTIIGTGPFQLDATGSQKGSLWMFKKNPDYWQAGRPYLDELRYLVLADESTIQAAFKTKQIDVMDAGSAPSDIAENRQKAYPDAVVFAFENSGAINLYMNMRRPPFNNLNARKAVALAIDPEEIARTMQGGKAAYAVGGVFPGTFTDQELRQMLKYDPAEAKRLLTEAGYGAGLDLEFLYPGKAFGEAYITEMQLFQSQMKRVGVNLTLKAMDLAEYLSRTRGNTYDLTLRSSSPGMDVDSYLYGSFHPSSNRNYNGVDDPKLTPLIEAQRREPDPKKRMDIVRGAGRYIAENALGITSRSGLTYQMWQGYVKDYQPNLGRRYFPATTTWLDK